MALCADCGALVAGAACPLCTGPDPVVLDARRTRQRSASDTNFELPPWSEALLVAAMLVPLSSMLGVRAWETGALWIWTMSLAADAAFVVGTLGAHMAALWIGRHIQHRNAGIAIAAVVGGLLHWLVYTLSWQTVLTAQEGEALNLPGNAWFVGHAGLFGLMLCGAVAGLGTWRLTHRLRSPLAAAEPTA